MTESFKVLSTFGPYDVKFVRHQDNSKFEKLDSRSDYVLVADRDVWSTYADKYSFWHELPIFLVEANEETKTLQMVEQLANWLVNNECSKSTTILAFGGGVIQDLVTFTARVFHRGCRWEYYPTTLLSQADSCIGSKCALNLMPHKNQIGTVYAPKRVVIDTELLQTLPEEELISGFGEIFKLSVTGPDFFYPEFRFFLERRDRISLKNENIENWIYKSLLAKKSIIEQDELESDLRRILNYGHSFGHALEALTLNEISHGKAVVFGMDLINFLGVQWGLTEVNFYKEFNELLRLFFGNTEISIPITPQELVNQLKTDKKMEYGQINFAVPLKPGDIRIVKKSLDTNLISLVGNYLENENVFTFA